MVVFSEPEQIPALQPIPQLTCIALYSHP